MIERLESLEDVQEFLCWGMVQADKFKKKKKKMYIIQNGMDLI